MSNTNFPTSIDSPTNPTAANTLASPAHHLQHGFENDAIVALETKVGTNGSADTTSVDFKLSGVPATDKAASKTGTETLTNKTLSTGTVVSLGSDATGDLYYRNSGGSLTRLPVGSSGQILGVSGGLPAFVSNPAASNGSTSVAGVFQKATTADITAGTTTGSTGALLVVGADAVGTPGNNKLVQFTSVGKYPAADGSLITNIANPVIYKNGVTTYNLTTASGNQTIAHGLGKAPTFVEITALLSIVGALTTCEGAYNGTTSSNVYSFTTGGSSPLVTSGATTNIITALNDSTGTNFQVATITVDATNITLAWTKTGFPTGTVQILWKAQA